MGRNLKPSGNLPLRKGARGLDEIQNVAATSGPSFIFPMATLWGTNVAFTSMPSCLKMMGPEKLAAVPAVLKLTTLPARSWSELISGLTKTCTSDGNSGMMWFTRCSRLPILALVRKCSSTSP